MHRFTLVITELLYNSLISSFPVHSAVFQRLKRWPCVTVLPDVCTVNCWQLHLANFLAKKLINIAPWSQLKEKCIQRQMNHPFCLVCSLFINLFLFLYLFLTFFFFFPPKSNHIRLVLSFSKDIVSVATLYINDFFKENKESLAITNLGIHKALMIHK